MEFQVLDNFHVDLRAMMASRMFQDNGTAPSDVSSFLLAKMYW